MRYTRNLRFLLAVTLGVSSVAWSQGGRRGAPPQTEAPPNATGRGGRGATGTAAGGAGEFYNYDTTAGSTLGIPDGQPAETHQKITVNGQALDYTARAGHLPLHNATTGLSEAHIFYTSYSKDGVAEASTRPIVFFLAGAPGVAAGWQEFGGFGPKRINDSGDAGAGMVDNPDTLLGSADLVFVNPVGTAFSRPDQPARGPSFWNTAGDLASLGEFVRSFISRYNRRNSPLFLAGDDFGTGRVAGLAGYLNEHQIPVRGVVLLSMTPSADALAGDAHYLTLMPSLTIAAWHHKKLTPELNGMSVEQIAGQARQFASREYLHALYKGDRMTADERTKIVADLSRMTGLSKAFVVNNDLRIALDRFSSELLRDQHRGLSNSDARVTGFVPAPPGGGRGGGRGGFAPPAPNPIDFNLSSRAASFLPAYEGYLRHDLAFKGAENGIYYLLTGGVGPFISSGSDDASLANAFARNPNLRLFVAVNYYDLNAPFYATEFTLAHLNVSPEVRARNITVAHFEAGQMPYTDNKALVRLQKDLSSFIGQAAPPARK
jgi:carboxypeptidase C (cathepsin A)